MYKGKELTKTTGWTRAHILQHGGSSGISSASWDSWLIRLTLQLQVTEEELLEFPEVRHDQITTSHTDNPVFEVVLSTEKSSFQNSCRSCGSCSVDTPSRIKVKKLYYRQPVTHRRWLVRRQTFDHRKWKDGQLSVHTPIDNIHTPSILTAYTI